MNSEGVGSWRGTSKRSSRRREGGGEEQDGRELAVYFDFGKERGFGKERR